MTQVLTRNDRYLADFQAFERSLHVNGSAWVHRVRQQALSHFANLGFPTARRGNEEWKYTDVNPIANSTFQYPFDFGLDEVEVADIRRVAPWNDSWINLVFVNGHYSESLTTGLAEVNGSRVTNLADAIISDRDVVERHLTRYASFEVDGFAALNTAFLRDGAFVHIPDDHKLQTPLHLIFVTSGTGQPAVSHPRALIVVGRHSKLAIVESYVSLSPARHFTNAVSEIVVGEGAEVEHYRFLNESPEAFHVGVTRVHQGQNSMLYATSFAQGAALARNDFQVLLDAPGSSCFLNGLYMTSGTQHLDNHMNIDHAKPHTTSRIYYKGILDGNSKAVFSGRVVVRKDAQKTDAQQRDKNLILSDGAEVYTKPTLEINADDVKCSHGATAGQIEEDTIFYLRSRGLDLATASSILIHAFASEILDTIHLEPFRVYLDRLILGALPSFHLRGIP